MASAFDEVMGWAARGRLEPERVDEALDALGAAPQADEWRRAASLLLLWMGVVSLASGMIFFFAYNWQALSRLERLGLADLCGLVALGAYARDVGGERGRGRRRCCLVCRCGSARCWRWWGRPTRRVRTSGSCSRRGRR